MNPIYVDIRELLISGGFESDDIFGAEWGSKYKQILILGSGGPASDLKNVYEIIDFQVLVRGDLTESDMDVYIIAKQVYTYLCGLGYSACINDTNYQGFEPTSNLAGLGKDENSCFIYSMNFRSYRNAF